MHKIINLDLLTSTIFISILSLYITVTLINVPLVPVAGKYIFLGLIAIMFALILQRRFISYKEFKLFLPYLFFSLVYLVNINGISDTQGLMTVFNQFAYMMVIYTVLSINWTKFQIKSMSALYYVSLPILILLIFIFPGHLNTNTIGSFAFFLAFFPLLYLVGYSKGFKKSRILIILALTTIAIFATDTRSVLLSAVSGLVTFIFWKSITKNKLFFYLYFMLIVAYNYFIVVVYPNLYKWEHFYTLNQWSIKLTDKPIMTGRNTIWAQLVDLISLKPWLGYGASVVPEDFLSTSLSAHNLYLQIGLQAGLVGIILLFLFFFVIWNSFWKNKTDPKVKLASCFFISILIHQSFEVTLTHNQFSIGLLQWLIVAFGLNYVLNKTKINEIEPS